jgi:energy-coupling factor transport system ATP-binding protein
VGQNGSGKTTLVRHLNGLLRPTTGEVFVAGQDTHSTRIARLAAIVGLTFQDPDRQIFAGTVRGEVAFGPHNLGLRGDALAEAVNTALEVVGLSRERDTNPYDLGYSRRKLLSIASVLAMRTPVVVLDEPTTGQDARGVRTVEAILRGLSAEGRTVIAVSHDLRFVAQNFERVVVMRTGRVVLDGPPAEVFAVDSWPVLRSTNLEPPYAARVGAALGLGTTPTEQSVVAAPRQHAEDASHAARGRELGRRLRRVHAPVARPVERHEGRHLAVPSVDRAVDDRLAQPHGGVVEDVAGVEVVGAVDDDVVAGDQPLDVVGPQPLGVLHHRRLGVQPADRQLGRVDLAHAQPIHAVEHLALEVRLVDHVVVDEADRPHPGCGEVEGGRRAEPAGADEQHLRVEERALSLLADLGDEHLPRVPALLARREELDRLLPPATAILPLRDRRLQVDDVRVAELDEPGRGARRATADGAMEQERRVPVGDELMMRPTTSARGSSVAPATWPASHSLCSRTSMTWKPSSASRTASAASTSRKAGVG